MKNLIFFAPMWPTKGSPGFGSFVSSSFFSLEKKFENNIDVVHSSTDLNSSKYHRFFDLLYISLVFVFKGFFFYSWYIHYLPISFPFIAIFARLFKKKVFVNFHGDELTGGGLKRRFLRFSLHFIFKGYKNLIFIVPSAYFEEIVKLRYPSREVFISPSGGVPDEWFFIKNNKIKESNIINLGYIGRLDKGKNWEIIFNISDILKKNGVNNNIVICGWGDEVDKIKYYSDIFQVDVNFIPGVDRKELVNIYKKIDILIFCTKREGESLGLVGLEAIAAGVPVISYNNYGPKTYIVHLKNGFLIETSLDESEEELISWIFNYINDMNNFSRQCSYSVLNYSESKVSCELSKYLFGKIKS